MQIGDLYFIFCFLFFCNFGVLHCEKQNKGCLRTENSPCRK